MDHEATDTRINAMVEVLRANGFLQAAATQHVAYGRAQAREANVNRELPTTSARPASTTYRPTVVVPYSSRVNVAAAMQAMLLRNSAMAVA